MDLLNYAASIQKRFPAKYAVRKPSVNPRLKRLKLKALLVDVYGTFFTSTGNYLEEALVKEALLKTIREFNLKDSLKRINPGEKPWQTLEGLYLQEIELEHKRKRRNGIKYPEVKIEKIWKKILLKLQKHGYRIRKTSLNSLSFKIAYFFSWVWDSNRLYPSALGILLDLKEKGFLLGIVSNSQFYTLLDLQLLVGKGKMDFGWKNLFDERLCSFSFRAGVSKPNKKIFARVLRNLREKGIKRKEVAFIGNDLLNDVYVAKKLGLKTILFAGDKNSLKLRKDNRLATKTKPNLIVTDWKQLLKVLTKH
jgi:putative hydrolase of the HAD superfamily